MLDINVFLTIIQKFDANMILKLIENNKPRMATFILFEFV